MHACRFFRTEKYTHGGVEYILSPLIVECLYIYDMIALAIASPSSVYRKNQTWHLTCCLMCGQHYEWCKRWETLLGFVPSTIRSTASGIRDYPNGEHFWSLSACFRACLSRLTSCHTRHKGEKWQPYACRSRAAGRASHSPSGKRDLYVDKN